MPIVPVLQFQMEHPIPVLPIDRLLVMHVVRRILRQFKSLTGVNGSQETELYLEVLLSLVVIRVYLDRKPSDDDDIWHLWTSRRIVRRWTDAELALACYLYNGPEDLRREQKVAITAGMERYTQFTRETEPDVVVEVVEDANGDDHIWTAAPQGQGLYEPSASKRIAAAPTPPADAPAESQLQSTAPPRARKRQRAVRTIGPTSTTDADGNEAEQRTPPRRSKRRRGNG